MGIAPRGSFLNVVLTGVAILLFSGCSGAEPNWEGLVQDSAGVSIVLNRGQPVWGDQDGWVLSEVLSIGIADGEPEYMFGRIDDIGALSNGTIVVADGMAQQLRLFTPDGQWKLTVGQPGEGPGEFGWRGLHVLVGPGDTLLVLDEQNQRANLIGSDGAWLDSWPAYGVENGWLDGAWDYSRTGRIVSHRYQFPGMESDEAYTHDFVVVRHLDGLMGDTVGRVLAGQTEQVPEGRRETVLYAGEPTASLCPDNSLITGRQDQYEIRRFGPTGNLEQVVRLDRRNAPITASDQTRLLQHFREAYMQTGFGTAWVEDLLSGVHFTETYPAFARLSCGPGGSIWVQPWRSVSSLADDELPEGMIGSESEVSARFDVFDRKGRYLGVIPLPTSFRPYRFHGEYLYGRWRDSLNVEYVKVLRVEGIAPQAGAEDDRNGGSPRPNRP